MQIPVFLYKSGYEVVYLTDMFVWFESNKPNINSTCYTAVRIFGKQWMIDHCSSYDNN